MLRALNKHQACLSGPIYYSELREGFKVGTWASVYNYNQYRSSMSNLNKQTFAAFITNRKIFPDVVTECIPHI